MTARESYEYVLIELNKLNVPTVLLESFNYFFNKAVRQYINLTFSEFENTQVSLDNLRVLKTTAELSVEKGESGIPTLLQDFYYTELPRDYYHLISCIVGFKLSEEGKTKYKCYDKDHALYYPATLLSSDKYSQIVNNAYLKPTYQRPYYSIVNINSIDSGDGSYEPFPGLKPTNPDMDNAILDYNNGSTTDKGSIGINGENYDQAYAPSNLVQHKTSQGDRLANASSVKLEIKTGEDKYFIPDKVYVDYIKAPMFINLTYEQLNSTEDYSQLLEFPDYVCFEIVNIVLRLILENIGDPRLQTNIPINATIADTTLSTK